MSVGRDRHRRQTKRRLLEQRDGDRARSRPYAGQQAIEAEAMTETEPPGQAGPEKKLTGPAAGHRSCGRIKAKRGLGLLGRIAHAHAHARD